jgi:mRNA-degrading endonuclease YafQ of YafQ-DinJ toxin-antitoxin module
MAKVTRTQRFNAQLKRRANNRIRRLYDERLRLFQKNPHDPSLNAHPLKHDLKGYWSFGLTGDEGTDDFRIIYRKTREGYVFFDFGTHDQLYRPWRRPAA